MATPNPAPPAVIPVPWYGHHLSYAQLEHLLDLSQSIPDCVKILRKARVTKLVKDQSGAVTGVEYIHNGKISTALGPVILANGGYAADFTDDSLLKKYRSFGTSQQPTVSTQLVMVTISHLRWCECRRYGEGPSAPNQPC